MPHVVSTISDAKDVYNLALTSQRFFTSRDQRITKFRDLVRQIDWKQRQKTGNYARFEGNESGSFFQTMVQLLSKNDLRHRIPYSANDNEQDRELKGQVERLIVSTYRDVDNQRPKRMESVKLQTAVAQFMGSDGWICAEVVKNDNSDKPLVDIRLHDNLDAHGQWGPDGLQVITIRSNRTLLQVNLEYPSIAQDKRYNSATGNFVNWTADYNIEVYSCYYKKSDGVYYGVVVNGQWGVKPYKLDWIDEIPVAVMPVNGLPYRTNRRLSDKAPDDLTVNTLNFLKKTDWTQDAGRGIFFMNEELYPKFNELWAQIFDITDTEARGTYFKRTEEGVDTDLTIGRGRDVVNPLKKDEEIGRVPPGGLGKEVLEALQALSSMLQRGGISWQLMGQLPSEQFSGFAIGQLISAAMTIANPYVEGMGKLYETLNQFILKAYQSEGGKTKIRTWREGVSFVEEEMDLELIKDKKFYFECQLKPGLPDDLANKINIAAAAKQSKLLDDLTILDEIIGVEDPELIMDRRTEMEVLDLPTVKLRRAAAQMIKQGNMEAAVAIIQELQMLQGQQQLQQGQIQTQLAQMQQMLGVQNQGDMNEQGQGGVGLAGGAPGSMEANTPSPEQTALETTGGQPGAEGIPPEALPMQQRGVIPQGLQALLGRLRFR